MNGRIIFDFVSKNINISIKKIIKKENLKINDIDLFILHQGSKFVIDTLSKQLNIENSKIVFSSKNYGNTVSSTIPIALIELEKKKILPKKQPILIMGFGVGYSLCGGVFKFD